VTLSNLPPGLTEAHPYFHPPEPEPCQTKGCDGEVLPGDKCDVCDERMMDDDDYYEMEMDRQYEMERDREMGL
jgi:hypothetical protein